MLTHTVSRSFCVLSGHTPPTTPQVNAHADARRAPHGGRARGRRVLPRACSRSPARGSLSHTRILNRDLLNRSHNAILYLTQRADWKPLTD